MKKYIFNLLLIAWAVLISFQGFSQVPEKYVKIAIAPDHTDWTYRTGEKVRFSVAVTKNSELLQNVKIKYEFGPEMMVPLKRDSAILKNGQLQIDGGTMNQPGFLRLKVKAEVEGSTYENLATASFDPELIKPTTELPADFVQFWDNAKAEVAKVPMDIRLTLLPERCTSSVNVYQVNIQSYRRTRLYGVVCIPKKEGKIPGYTESAWSRGPSVSWRHCVGGKGFYFARNRYSWCSGNHGSRSIY